MSSMVDYVNDMSEEQEGYFQRIITKWNHNEESYLIN